MERAINLLFGTTAFVFLALLCLFADLGNYKAVSVLVFALVINGYILYLINKERFDKWMKKH